MGLRVAESMLRTKGERSVQSRSTDRRRKEGRKGGREKLEVTSGESSRAMLSSWKVRPSGHLAVGWRCGGELNRSVCTRRQMFAGAVGQGRKTLSPDFPVENS